SGSRWTLAGGTGGADCSGAACSTVGSSAVSWPTRSRSAWRCAASVALKSSASGPSRMLARRRAIEHLLCEVTVGLGGRAGRVVLEHRAALDGRFGVADGLLDARLEDEVSEVLLEHLHRLAAVQGSRVVHRRENALDLDDRIQVLPDHAERVLELDETAEREVLALDGDDHAVRGSERVDREEAEGRRRVDEDVVVAVAHREQRFLQRALAADHARKRHLSARKVD